MVRINLIPPRCLADQHLIAEYNEILMLLGYVRKYPARSIIPRRYCLGKGHILFFKNKLRYLQKRHALLAQEMRRRGYVPTKTVVLRGFSTALCTDWKPRREDIALITKRLTEKLKKKPKFYTYHGVHRPPSFFIKLLS